MTAFLLADPCMDRYIIADEINNDAAMLDSAAPFNSKTHGPQNSRYVQIKSDIVCDVFFYLDI